MILGKKSQLKWVVEGDKNTKFFHSILKNNFAKCSIKGIHVNGLWCESLDIIKQVVADHFPSIFIQNIQVRPSFSSPLFSRLSPADSSFLESSISLEEVKEAVWCCAGSKAPEPDGFNFNFIKAYWDVILASWLAKVIASVISPNQTDFIAGRQILDGCLVANEIILMASIKNLKLLLLKVTILEACSKGFFKEVHLASNGKNLSLLQYADDAFFFGDCSRLNAKNLIYILKCFKLASGLKINIGKSWLFRVGIPIVDVEAVASSLGCSHDSLPFIYIFLLVDKRMRLGNGWAEVINRFHERLSTWKAKSVSICRRLTLIKFVLGILPIYFLSLFKDPINIINLPESIRFRFFWGFKESHYGIYWVKWKSILLDSNKGGLGVG
ncbi:hypothetical protein Tco_1355409 [Tanacetum coccineum]